MENSAKNSETAEVVSNQHDISEQDTRIGFLPIQTNWFDRLFISVVIWIAMCLFWFRFLEPAGLSIWICNAIAFAVTVFIIRRG